ncbi:hypothetical protein [Gallaecimonas xiamenensis]|uniref:Uncharacterized protein n=1 Tax=Gallaecimonas xiamenensis 3-C-1 TaxID=745411 RepID=K2IWE5_9GAMM|nr:hypothetical protein [Gallaecimonas xiamenensis]EKE67168.1 hypothetical protein B3C1_19158 [Gallaecimonas xiamenensis 3-C-1]
MDINMLHQGALCCTRQGTGWVVAVDRENRIVRLKDQKDSHMFEVDINAVMDEPQIHTPEDGYY